MLRPFFVLASGLALASVANGQENEQYTNATVTDDEMGPAAFMWPPDREWSGDMDNRAPCGSRASAGNRTEFPLTNGAVSLVAQDDYYNTRISISYDNDPTSNDDFEVLVQEHSISDLDPGHTCVLVPDAPRRISAGDNATLQIVYRADWDAPHNQTFYACADITFVQEADFDFAIPCFNSTEPGDDNKAAGETATSSVTATHQPLPSSSSDRSESASGSDSDSDDSSSSGGSKKLSGGAIAGIVIGSVAGVALIGIGALLLWRRREKKKRDSRIARMEENARNHDIALGKVPSSRNSAQ